MARLCLNMIVRNEADRILRCLESVVPYISCYAIVDTGSTDRTPDIINDFFQARGIPGFVVHDEFVNFEQARNKALACARSSDLEYDYLLLCDADMQLVVTDPTVFDNILARGLPAVNLQQRAGTLYYYNARLLSAKSQAKYIGVTHEYLDAAGANLEGAHFIDHADGANRPEKYKRDIRLLKQSLVTEPNNVRTWFYLAQSYREAGNWKKAAFAYKKRVELGGWDEEVWNAQLNYACALRNLGDEAGFVHHTLIAYNMRPSRAESVYDLANFYRTKGFNALAVLFAEAGMKIPYTKDVLFVSDYAYRFGFRDEFSISGFYLPEKREQAFWICNGLALDREAPHHSREQAKNNLFHYLKPLAEYVPFAAIRIPFTAPDGYIAMNPSVALIKATQEIAVIVRTVNYTITPEGYYAIRSSSDGSINTQNPIHTRNFLVRLTNTFEPVSVKEIEDMVLAPFEPKYNLVRGFEDMRLIDRGEDGLHFSACVRELTPQGWCEQVYGRIHEDDKKAWVTGCTQMLPHEHNADSHGEDLRFVHRSGGPVHYRIERANEKNWAPMSVPYGNGLRFVYRLGTLVDKDARVLSHNAPHVDTGHISGGSQVVHIPGTAVYLSLVHEARISPSNGKRYYQHRFAQLRHDGSLIKLSYPFYLHDKQIEFVAGLAWHPDGERLMISYGVRDQEAWIATVKWDDVRRFMI